MTAPAARPYPAAGARPRLVADRVEADVEDLDRVGQGADADHVDAGLGDGADGVQVDAARGLDGDAAGDQLHGRTHVVEAEVVQHDDVGVVGQGFLQLDQAVDL